MVALLALAAAAGWGGSDYAAGRAARRSSALSVVIGTHLTAALVLLVASVDPVGWGTGADGGGVAHADLAWGLLAGVSGGVGALFLYRGLARGSAAVVAPVTAAGAAVIPATFGLLTGDPSSPLTLGGIGTALVAIVLVSVVPSSTDPTDGDAAGNDGTELVARAHSALAVIERREARVATRVPARRALAGVTAAGLAGGLAAGTWWVFEPVREVPASGVGLGAFGLVLVLSTLAADAGAPRRRSSDRLLGPGLGDALLSGAGFALFYILTGQVGEGAGLWPMAGARSASAVVFAVCALMVGGGVLPGRGGRRIVVVAGLLDGVAAGCFLIATGTGSLSIVSVLSSLYPIATVALARVIDGERCHRLHLVGGGVAAAAVVMIAIG